MNETPLPLRSAPLLTLLPLALTLLAFTGRSAPPPQEPAQEPPPTTAAPAEASGPAGAKADEARPACLGAARQAALSQADFGLQVFQKLAAESPRGNLLLSPLSLATALTMVHAGARGETAEEMAAVLRFGDEGGSEEDPPGLKAGELLKLLSAPDPASELAVSQGLWTHQGYPIEEAYRALLGTRFGAEARSLDFVKAGPAARETINGAVSRQTRGRIPALLPEDLPKPTTRAILTSAVWFKGLWQKPFRERATTKRPFHLPDGTSAPVETMFLKAELCYGSDDEVQLLRLAYGSAKAASDTSLLLVLPRTRGALNDVLAKMDASTLARWASSCAPQEVRVLLPKVKLAARRALGSTLQSQGMRRVFSDEADLSGISGNRELKLTRVLHDAVIEWDERGTEAAAATAAMVGIKSVRKTPVFEANQPFFFALLHEPSRAALFLGRVSNPAG